MRGQDITAQTAAANQARQSTDNAASRAVQLRGQNMTDARARETNAAGGKPPAAYQWAEDGSLQFIKGGPADPSREGAKPLLGAVLKQIQEARDNSVTISRLADAFKPAFANKGLLGLGADTQIGVSAALGVDGDAVDWWKNYRKQAELIERHALFGAALTPTEQASWRSADISPGMDNKVIERNLKNRKDLSAKILDNTRQDLIDAGHSEDKLNKIAGRTPQPAAASDIDALIKKYAK
jgi:hypothetical protein